MLEIMSKILQQQKNYPSLTNQAMLWKRQMLSTMNLKQNETRLNTYTRWRVPILQLETT